MHYACICVCVCVTVCVCEWRWRQPGGHGWPGAPVQLAVRSQAAERDVPPPPSSPPDLLALHGRSSDSRLASGTLRNAGAPQFTEPRGSSTPGATRPQRRPVGGPVGEPRVRELWLHPDATVETRWHRSLPVQRMRSLQ